MFIQSVEEMKSERDGLLREIDKISGKARENILEGKRLMRLGKLDELSKVTDSNLELHDRLIYVVNRIKEINLDLKIIELAEPLE